MSSDWLLDGPEMRLEPTSPRLLPPGGAWPGAVRVHLGTLRQRIQAWQLAGLAGLLGISWLAELSLAWLGDQLPALRAAATGQAPVVHACWEALCILPFAWLIQLAVRRTLDAARYLEGQVAHCPCCDRVESGGRWMGLAEFIRRNSELRLTPLACSRCLRKEL